MADRTDDEPTDLSILEETGVAFDPTTQHLDLTKDEKRRTTALMLAIKAYDNLIIKDAAYLKEAADLARRGDGPKLNPATINAMVEAACKFDYFIATGDRIPPGVDAAIADEEAQRDGGARTEEEVTE